MPLSTVLVTGRIPYADDQNPTNARVRFTLIRLDVDGFADATIPPEPVEFELGADGELSAALWPNSSGARGSYYTADLVVRQKARGDKVTRLGVFELDAAGDLNDLLERPIDLPPIPSVEAQINGLAEEISNLRATGDFGERVVTLRIPTDYATLQEAIDDFGPNIPGDDIELRIEADEMPTSGITVSGGDYSGYRITAEARDTAFVGLKDSATVLYGETITQTTTGATGVVQAYANGKILLLSDVTGTFNTTNLLTGSISGALGTSPALVRANVVLCPTFTGNVVSASGIGKAPILDCVFAGAGTAGSIGQGYDMRDGADGQVLPNAGVLGAWSNGCFAYRGAKVVADFTVWDFAAQNGSTGAAVHGWGGRLSAEYASAQFSGYYGAQASHAGTTPFRGINVSGAFRYGIRGSDIGIVDADNAIANDCGLYGVYGFNQSVINFREGTATGCGTANIASTQGSHINASNADASDGDLDNLLITSGGQITFAGGDATGAGQYGASVNTGDLVCSTADFSNATLDGIHALIGADIRGTGVVANNCGSDGFFFEDGAKGALPSASATGAGQRGLASWYGADVSIQNGTLTGAGTQGVYCFGGTVSFDTGNARMGASDAATDIVVLGGGQIRARAATGGLSKAANTLTADGVIYQ